MNILILGATGFVGQAVTQMLLETEAHIIAAGRNIELIKQQFPTAQPLYCDFLKEDYWKDWSSHLVKVDVIINCIGVFYHPDKQKIWTIHFDAPKALYEAAKYHKRKQIVHLSALGVETYNNEYAQSKKAIEDFLTTLSIPYVILRPSLIYGSGSKGGIDIMKKLASCPKFVPLPGDGAQLFQPIYLEDLAQAIKKIVLNPPSSSVIISAVSSQIITLRELLTELRKWLRLGKAFFIKIPFCFLKVIGKLGDYYSLSLINTQAIEMLKQGNYVSEKEAMHFQEITSITPCNFAQGLNRHPPLIETYWYIRLSFMRPVLRVTLAFMWLASALTSTLSYARPFSYELLKQMGIFAPVQPFLLYGASFLNGLIGMGLLLNYKIKANCQIQFLVIFLYTLIISLYLPYLWLEPFGPVVKNIPILLAVLILYVLES